MAFFSTIRELARDLKRGASYSFSQNHSFVEKSIQPRLVSEARMDSNKSES